MKVFVIFISFLILTSCLKSPSKEIKEDLTEIMDFNNKYTFDEYLKALSKIDMYKEYPDPNNINIK